VKWKLMPSWLRADRRRPVIDQVVPQVDALLVDLKTAVIQLQRQNPPHNGPVPARRGT
jgi:hypothetical protein